MELSYVLLSHGYRTVVLNEALAYGLAPETVPEYLKQRTRWCVGTIQHLRIKTGPIRGKFQFIDRLFYVEGVFYWLSFVFLVCLLIAPMVFWLTGVAAISGPSNEIVWILLPRLMLRTQIIYWLSMAKVTPVIVTVMNALGAFHFSPLHLEALVSPFGVSFNVTSKGGKRDCTVVRWKLFLIFTGLGVAITGLMFMNLCGMLNVVPVGEMTALNVTWSLCSILVCFLCALVCVELPKPESDIWVMREVVKTRPIETIKALVLRLFLVDVLGAYFVDHFKKFATDAGARKRVLMASISWCITNSAERKGSKVSIRCSPRSWLYRLFVDAHQPLSTPARPSLLIGTVCRMGRWFYRPLPDEMPAISTPARRSFLIGAVYRIGKWFYRSPADEMPANRFTTDAFSHIP